MYFLVIGENMETYYIDKMEIMQKDEAIDHIMDMFLELKFSINDASDMMEEDFRNLLIVCGNSIPNYYTAHGNKDILEYKKYLLAEYKSTYYVWDIDFGFQLSEVVL